MPEILAKIGRQADSIWQFESFSPPDPSLFTLPFHDESKLLAFRTSTGLQLRTEPAVSALVIIDMQNYFLSAALGRSKGAGHKASDNLINHAIPAARKAGIQIIWVNWGLTQQELDEMPTAMTRCFGFSGVSRETSLDVLMDRHGVPRPPGTETYAGLGSTMGTVTVPCEEGGPSDVTPGACLMRDTWNAALYFPLANAYKQGLSAKVPDVLCHKNRMSGMWGATTPLQQTLEKKGLKTLFFAGVNTDQCVGGTLTDAFSKGYNCVLLKDGCGTTSPDYAQKAWEYNCENTFGFVMTCQDFSDGVNGKK